MKLVSGEVDIVKDEICKVMCFMDRYSNMTLSFYKKDDVFFKNVNVTGLDMDTLKKTWSVMEYCFKFVFALETEQKFV